MADASRKVSSAARVNFKIDVVDRFTLPVDAERPSSPKIFTGNLWIVLILVFLHRHAVKGSMRALALVPGFIWCLSIACRPHALDYRLLGVHTRFEELELVL